MGPAYNYDDRGLTEEWMMNFRDGMSATGASEEDIERAQIESLMEIIVGKVQDKVCNDLKVLTREPVGLGPDLKEQPVWGIDSHTRRLIQLLLEDRLWGKNIPNISDEIAARLSVHNGITAAGKTAHTTEKFKDFLEKTLLPAINAIPTCQAHDIKNVLNYVLQVFINCYFCKRNNIYLHIY